MTTAQPPLLVPSPAVQQPPVNQQGVKLHSFREASVERMENILTITKTLTGATQQNINKVLGTGFMRSLIVQVVSTAATNAASVTLAEGGPYDVVDQTVLHDVNGDLVNLSRGSHWRFEDLYFGANHFPPSGDAAASNTLATQLQYASNDPAVWNLPSLSGATGGSFTFWLELPTAINDRDLRCLIGKHDCPLAA